MSPPARAGSCNVAPVATADAYDTFGYQFAADVLNNDRDDDGELLTLTVLSETCANHTVAAAHGVLIVTPVAGHQQPGPLANCTISYRIVDERGAQANAQVTVTPIPLFADGFESGDVAAWTLGSGQEPN